MKKEIWLFFEDKMGCLFKYKQMFFVVYTGFTVLINHTVFAQSNLGATASLAWRIEPYYMNRKDGKPGLAMSVMLREQIAKGPVSIEVQCNSAREKIYPTNKKKGFAMIQKLCNYVCTFIFQTFVVCLKPSL